MRRPPELEAFTLDAGRAPSEVAAAFLADKPGIKLQTLSWTNAPAEFVIKP